MDEYKSEVFRRAIEDMAFRSLRSHAEEELSTWKIPDDDLVLLTIIGLKDPCRPGVREAVQLCTNAGVKIFNEVNARKPDEMNVFKGVTKNRLFMLIVGLTIVLQVIKIFFLGKFFSIVRLNWKLWLVSVAIGFVSWPLAIVGKMILVSETPFSDLSRLFKSICPRKKNTNVVPSPEDH
ncbi:calcium-transporting ATPase 8, plasma membrane-type-like isoform X2 [Impatiens glandulifera]|uniref:calcium-transporting ATPase 8, plasma membrane-type-like isoform X2 n=1 Tax=Impatiens glandulifera TaxID=253017 RepID=UPI001FB114FF|nr:calcium-transporting ATPase 8, plasma membrane-type-like isoform X2 [Impatiens glandulifera]